MRRAPREWLARIADAESLESLGPSYDAPRPSPFLSRWSISPQDDDGVVIARLAIRGRVVLAAAQDARFLGGSVGAAHAAALERLFVEARASKATAVVLLLASGGVRLHEANPAEIGLARALRALIDARAAGVPVVALGVGDVFGGASMLACAADRLGLLPEARLGLSGPRVIATASPGEIDADDASAVTDVFGAAARALRGQADLVRDDIEPMRDWITRAIRGDHKLVTAVREQQERLTRELAGLPASDASPAPLPVYWRESTRALDTAAGIWEVPGSNAWIAAASGSHAVTARALNALDGVLLRAISPSGAAPKTVVLLEDSAGHEISRRAEEMGLSRFLAHHACVLGVLRAAGVSVRALLTGQGHSAAFFVNALQADRLMVWQGARSMAMDPRAVARVTGLDHEALVASLEADPVLGHAAALLTQWRPDVRVVTEVDAAALAELVGA